LICETFLFRFFLAVLQIYKSKLDVLFLLFGIRLQIDERSDSAVKSSLSIGWVYEEV